MKKSSLKSPKTAPSPQSNTILNYFGKTPSKTPSLASTSSASPSVRSSTPLKRKDNISFDDDDASDRGDRITPKKRFKRLLIDSEEENTKEDDEYKPSEESNASSDMYEEEASFSKEDDDDYSEEEEETPKKKPKKAPTVSVSKNKKNSWFQNSKKSFTSFSKSKQGKSNNTSQATCSYMQAIDREWPHMSYPFLQSDQMRDGNGRKYYINGEINPDCDPNTLYVPKSFLDAQTPAVRQWWEMKAANFGTVLFFKMGKFYELYHMDAVLIAKEAQIQFMKGNIAHAGFPEKSYRRYADVLIQKGYPVARIEQTETPEMMQQRTKGTKAGKFAKVVKREVCRISTIGTRFMSDIDSDALTFSNSYLYAFSFKIDTDGRYEFGISFVDVSIGKFYLTQFKDDRHYSKLRTLLSHYMPAEFIFAGNAQFGKLLELVFPGATRQKMRKFWSSSETLQYIAEKNISSKMTDQFRSQILDPSDVLDQTSLPAFELAVSSLGGIIQYLEKSLIADDILSMGLFEMYNPLENSSTKLSHNLILDSVTMKNLEILRNLRGEESSTLFKIINKCSTPFGKRLLRNWLCLPLCNQREELELRQEAVRELAENEVVQLKVASWTSVLSKLPDLERLLTTIHSASSLKRSRDHPDSRAILFEGDLYRKRRINHFLNTLDGFQNLSVLMGQISALLHTVDENNPIKSKLIMKLVSLESEGGLFPELESKVAFFRDSFDAEKARKDMSIIPNPGADNEYDEAIEDIAEAKRGLDEYLNTQKLYFKVRVCYFNEKPGKNRYQLEIPDSVVIKTTQNKNETYKEISKKKGFKRFHTPTILKLVSKLEAAEGKRATLLSDIFRRILEKFDQDYQSWSKAIKCAAKLDALISLSKTKQIFESYESYSSLPDIVWPSSESNGHLDAIFEAEELRNACLIETRQLIPNDVMLKNGTMVLTGPNMAGKTTLMRSIGLAVILAQIGAYVPAKRCTLSPVDRIFTRIGAYDEVIESQSTFMVELNETVAIVRHATTNSLVLIDELGRGTSTFDGIAIAQAVLEELADIRCRCIFSTHFHSIVDELQDLPFITLAHMDYLVENENKLDPTEADVIFLYRLKEGICSQSYGYNVAKLAGIDRNILRLAYKYGHAFELKVESCRLFDTFVQTGFKDAKQSVQSISQKKVDQLADYLSELIITRKGLH